METAPYISFSGEGWESKELERQTIVLLKQGRFCKVIFHGSGIVSILNRGAARGGGSGIAYLTNYEVNKFMEHIYLLFNSHISSSIARREGGKLISHNNVILKAHLAGTSRPRNRAAESHNIDIDINGEPKSTDSVIQELNNNVLLNRDAAGSGEGGTSYLVGVQIIPREEFELASQNNVILNQGASRGNELPDAMSLNIPTSPGNYSPGFAPGTSKPRNRAAESHNINIDGEPKSIDSMIQEPDNNVLLNQEGAGGNEVGTAHLAGFQIIPEVELTNQNNVLPNQDAAAGGNELPDSMPLSMSTSPANYLPGFARGTSKPRNRASSPRRTQAAESHNIDFNGESDKKFS